MAVCLIISTAAAAARVVVPYVDESIAEGEKEENVFLPRLPSFVPCSICRVLNSPSLMMLQEGHKANFYFFSETDCAVGIYRRL